MPFLNLKPTLPHNAFSTMTSHVFKDVGVVNIMRLNKAVVEKAITVVGLQTAKKRTLSIHI